MRIRTVRMGNSRGAGELDIKEDRLVLAPDRPPRLGWTEAFAQAGSSGAGPLLLDVERNNFDAEEWTW